MSRRGIVSAGNMLVDHVHQIAHWPQPGWLVEIEHSQRATGGAPLNVLLTLARMETGLPLAALGLIGCDADGDYILQMLAQYQVDSGRVRDDRGGWTTDLFPCAGRESVVGPRRF
jgi:sugar/nucleoside kinase (ribokinase family)